MAIGTLVMNCGGRTGKCSTAVFDQGIFVHFLCEMSAVTWVDMARDLVFQMFVMLCTLRPTIKCPMMPHLRAQTHGSCFAYPSISSRGTTPNVASQAPWPLASFHFSLRLRLHDLLRLLLARLLHLLPSAIDVLLLVPPSPVHTIFASCQKMAQL